MTMLVCVIKEVEDILEQRRSSEGERSNFVGVSGQPGVALRPWPGRQSPEAVLLLQAATERGVCQETPN